MRSSKSALPSSAASSEDRLTMPLLQPLAPTSALTLMEGSPLLAASTLHGADEGQTWDQQGPMQELGAQQRAQAHLH